MHVHLPIAELSVNWVIVLVMGTGVGMLSGMFGVGGGFLITPLLIFYGIPPAVAVATGANQIVASSVTGVIGHWRRKAVDVRMGLVLLAGGVVGSVLGVWLFSVLRATGHIEVLISLAYVALLGIVGTMMITEGLSAIRARHLGRRSRSSRRRARHNWIHGLPFKMRFKTSRLYISALLPLMLGLLVGVMAAIMGVGGGFIMVPAMIYLLRMPTNVVVGTSLFQILFVTALVTVLHAVNNQTVDFVLALILLIGSVLGVQFGVGLGHKMRGEQLRALLGAIVLAVCAKLAFDLFAAPADRFTLTAAGGS
ncbi:MAG: sulfite exporter TauE/SafE family protein [Alphaproteobacteria bacterium]